MAIEITKTEDALGWNDYIDRRKEAGLHLLFETRRLYQEVYKHEPVNLMAFADGKSCGVFPMIIIKSRLFGKCAISLPFFDTGGVWADHEDIRELLYREGRKIAEEKGCRYMEIREFSEQKVLELPTREHKVTFVLPLSPNPDDVWNSFKDKVRNQIRKGEKAGLTSRFGGLELLNDFYNIYARNMRDLGTPCHGKMFFKILLELFGDNTEIFCVYKDEKPIAAALVMMREGRMEVPWAGSVWKYKSYSPNNFLYWNIIKYGCETGHKELDFGRATVGSGTYHFKKQWGGTEKSISYQYWLSEGAEIPKMGPDNPKYKFLIALWKLMPVWLTKIVGPMVIRHLG